MAPGNNSELEVYEESMAKRRGILHRTGGIWSPMLAQNRCYPTPMGAYARHRMDGRGAIPPRGMPGPGVPGQLHHPRRGGKLPRETIPAIVKVSLAFNVTGFQEQ